MSTTEIAGHDQPLKILRQAILHEKLHHGYIFHGPEQVGKKQVARLFAKRLLCRSNDLAGKPGIEPCGECTNCRKFDAGVLPDFHFIQPEDSGMIKIETIRQTIQALQLKPFESARKVCVIDSAEGMNIQSMNAFLKTLEEPPPFTTIILITANISALIPTIVSRCQNIRFGTVDHSIIADIVEKQLGTGRAEAERTAFLSQGKPGKALGLDFERETRLRAKALEFLLASTGTSQDKMMELARESAKEIEKPDLPDLFDYHGSLLRDLAAISAGESLDSAANRDIIDQLREIAQKFDLTGILESFEWSQKIRSSVRRNLNTELMMDILLLETGRQSFNPNWKTSRPAIKR